MKIKRVCKRCGKIFFKFPCRIKAGRGVYCSKECVKISVSYHCKGCGKKLFTAPSELKYKSHNQYCNRECFTKRKNITRICPTCKKTFTVWACRKKKYCGSKCWGEGIRKHEVVLYRGTKYYKTTFGYYVSRPKGKHGIMLHRQVYEDEHKIKLNDWNTIHHLNGIKTDNRPENLELWEFNHGKGHRVTDKIKEA